MLSLAHQKKWGMNMNLAKATHRRSDAGSDVMEHYDPLFKASVHANLFKGAENQLMEAIKESENRSISATKAVEKKLDDSVVLFDKKIDHLDKKFDHLDKKIDGVDKKLDDSVSYLDKKIDHLDKKIDHLDKKIDHLDKRIDDTNQQLGVLSADLNSVKVTVLGLHKWFIVIALSIFFGTIGIIASIHFF